MSFSIISPQGPLYFCQQHERKALAYIDCDSLSRSELYHWLVEVVEHADALSRLCDWMSQLGGSDYLAYHSGDQDVLQDCVEHLQSIRAYIRIPNAEQKTWERLGFVLRHQFSRSPTEHDNGCAYHREDLSPLRPFYATTTPSQLLNNRTEPHAFDNVPQAAGLLEAQPLQEVLMTDLHISAATLIQAAHAGVPFCEPCAARAAAAAGME